MPLLTSEHIDYIVNDLSSRGIVLEGFQEEVLDHLCTLVEKEMAGGKRFIDAYHHALKRFGYTRGLQQTQKQVLITDTQTTRLMFKNYFKIALRNLTKHRFYSLVNIAGLATGVASCLIISLFILNELSYDTQHVNRDRLYRVNFRIKFGNLDYDMAVTPPALAAAVLQDYPEVESVARIRLQGNYLVKRDKENFKEKNVAYADSSFFKVFTIPFLHGNPSKALTEPNTIVVSRKIADKYFPNENPIGQTLTFFNNWNNKIVGVMEDFPDNSQFHFEILVSMLNSEESKNNMWLSNNFHTYVLLKKGTDAKGLEKKFFAMREKYVGPQVREFLGAENTPEKLAADGSKFDFWLMPITDVHLRAKTMIEVEPASDIVYIYLFGAIALFILVIACINFMNLSTARSANRAKEVGVRKVLGSLRSHLVRQFLLESVLISVMAFLLALGLAFVFLPTFNDLSGKHLHIPVADPDFLFLFMGLSLFVGALAGIYPSFFLSAFKPVNVLKGKLALGMKSGLIRSGLVVFQFTISIFLIVGTITINRQLTYIQEKKIGFNKDQVIIIREAHAMGDQLESFKNEMLKNSHILSATISGSLPVAGTDRNNSTYWPMGKEPNQENMVGMQGFYVDYDYIKTLGMEIKDGRDFSRDFISDSTGIIINEAAAQAFNIAADPIGKKIETFAFAGGSNSIEKDKRNVYTVVGVVKNFHFESLRDNITPLGMFLSKSTGLISFRLASKNVNDVISALEKKWKQMAPTQPFEYTFLDDDFSSMYASEQRLGKIFAIFAGLAIIIACLGLFALSAFTAEQRTKEIGIRKVLGATVTSIVLLLSKEFGKLIIIAFVIAAPLSWLAVKWWLQSYSYKTEVGALVYLLAGISAFLVAWLTMGYQSIKAAASNPVNSLRSE
ncbi:ABC transporter permease [Chryseolinea soli]|nr:ABC transporter permease [Chryseolinea soli]